MPVGVGMAGFIDGALGLVRRSPNLGYRNVPLGSMLGNALGVPVRLENDAKCALLAEARFEAGRGREHLMLVIIGTGVGVGLYLDGQLHAGVKGLDGEIGHVVVGPEEGPTCSCGRRGCLEARVAGPALLKRYRDAGGQAVDVPDVMRFLASGESLARAIMEAAAAELAQALAFAAALVAPEIILLGGDVGSHSDPWLPFLRREIARRTLSGQQVGLEKATLGTEAGLVGAAALWMM